MMFSSIKAPVAMDGFLYCLKQTVWKMMVAKSFYMLDLLVKSAGSFLHPTNMIIIQQEILMRTVSQICYVKLNSDL